MIYLDIETLPAFMLEEEKRAMALRKVPANYKKPEAIDKWLEEHTEELWLRTALDPMRCRIACVGIAVDDRPVQVLWCEDEAAMLTDLADIIRRGPVCSHNGHGFDWPVLRARAMYHGCRSEVAAPDMAKLIRALYAAKPWDEHLVDTLRAWQGSGRPGGTLDAIAELMGISRAGNPGSGADIWPWWEMGRLDLIRAHVVDDVEVLRKVHKRLVWAGMCR